MNDTYYFRALDLTFHRDPSNKDKYLILTCAKNESEYIVEWIEYHLSIGFDKIIIADNNDIGNNSLLNTVAQFIEQGTVEVFDVRGKDAVQVGLYSDFCEIGDYKWCAYFDCDEFLELGVYPDIKSFLSTQKCDCVLVNWLMFGSNGKTYKEEGTIQERFPLPVSPILYTKENAFFKSIIRGGTHLFDNNWFNGSHLPTMSENRALYNLGGYCPYTSCIHASYPPRYKKIYLKHYYTKSFNEWLIKANRGWPDGTNSLNFSNYLCFNDNISLPIDKMKVNIFGAPDIDENFKKACDEFKVILIRDRKSFVYAFMSFILSLMDYAKGVVFLFADNDNIDDTLFAQILDFAYSTGNKAFYCFTEEEIDMAVNKYMIDNKNIYTITLG